MNISNWRKVESTDILLMYKGVQHANTLLLKSPSPITHYSPSFIEELHSHQDPKEMDLKPPHLFLVFCFKKSRRR